jgi:hypothetical protein
MIQFLIILFSVYLPIIFHPVYISTAEIVFQQDGTWSGEIKIFFDDLEDAIQNMHGKRPNLIQQNLIKHRSEITSYLTANLKFVQADKRLVYNASECHRLEDIVVITIEGAVPWQEADLSIENTILVELFETQKNIMTIQCSTEKAFFYLNKRNSRKLFTLPL